MIYFCLCIRIPRSGVFFLLSITFSCCCQFLSYFAGGTILTQTAGELKKRLDVEAELKQSKRVLGEKEKATHYQETKNLFILLLNLYNFDVCFRRGCRC
jgi:hypothetical protein